ncbi:SAM-dependent methyltransferase [Microbispora sp. NPDC049125]|uniref:SAM-dependent methyltransferase n=1 Tax=Microbispora sp. NPDC049125 TaxID=3154929 RepID=UPI003465C5C0
MADDPPVPAGDDPPHDDDTPPDGWPAPPGVDPSIPSSARVYDYALGGRNNYAIDRETAEKVFAVAPEMRAMARQNRSFLGRLVRFLSAEAGIRQFLDIGSGLPTQRNVHQVAQEIAPGSRVVYVDHDPVVLRYAEALLATSDTVTAVQADLRRPEEILGHPDVRGLIDSSQPVAVLLVAVLHFVPDEDDPLAAVARLKDAMAPGSHLAVSHVTSELRPVEIGRLVQLSARAGAPWVARDRAQIQRFLDGLEMVDPGLVTAPEWRPEVARSVDPEKMWVYAGVGRKR